MAETKNINVRIIIDKTDAVGLAAKSVNKTLLESYMQPMLLLLSGGSALTLLDLIGNSLVSGNITIGMLDERYSLDPKINNFSQMARSQFYKRAVSAGCGFISTKVLESETKEELAIRFEADLRNWKMCNAGGKIMAVMGIGDSGNTAGITPHPEDPKEFSLLFEDENRWVVGYNAGERNEIPLRVTVTNTFLRNEVDKAVVFMIGESKKQVLERTLSDTGAIPETPSRIIHEMKDVRLYTDIEIADY
jgi:6-phosphogluconolactonase/glucosamine-6-phosphate isomerase/deaminase